MPPRVGRQVTHVKPGKHLAGMPNLQLMFLACMI
jgi:hypothetical protein